MAGSSSNNIIDSEIMQFAPLIILLPMLAFPVILFLGKVFNRNPFWKDTMKEGGFDCSSSNGCEPNNFSVVNQRPYW